jgi:hypothetical protein
MLGLCILVLWVEVRPHPQRKEMTMNDKFDKNLRPTDGEDHANRDPITNEPGAHPVGTGVGAAAAGTAGAIVGTGLAGPLGGIVGAALGASVGGGLGHYAAEAANPTYLEIEPALRQDFPTRSYASTRPYEDYEEAYDFGANQRAQAQSPWSDALEGDLRARWDNLPAREGREKLDWDRAKPAVRDAWDTSEKLPRQ